MTTTATWQHRSIADAATCDALDPCTEAHNPTMAAMLPPHHCATCAQEIVRVDVIESNDHRYSPTGRILCSEDGTHSDNLSHAIAALYWSQVVMDRFNPETRDMLRGLLRDYHVKPLA